MDRSPRQRHSRGCEPTRPGSFVQISRYDTPLSVGSDQLIPRVTDSIGATGEKSTLDLERRQGQALRVEEETGTVPAPRRRREVRGQSYGDPADRRERRTESGS